MLGYLLGRMIARTVRLTFRVAMLPFALAFRIRLLKASRATQSASKFSDIHEHHYVPLSVLKANLDALPEGDATKDAIHEMFASHGIDI